MNLNELASRLALGRVIGDDRTVIGGLQMDNRKVQPGDMFICVKGRVFDGHGFARQAVEAGAVALLCEYPVDADVPQLIVPNVRYAMTVLASHFYGYPSNELKVIGITGTNGKTTTSYIVEHILSDTGAVTGLMGNIETKIGALRIPNTGTNTQESIDLQRNLRKMRDAGCDYCVMEVTSNGLDAGRVIGCRFRTAIFTNLTQDHLDYHQTMDNYKAAKGLLFSRLGNTFAADAESRQFAILNADEETSGYFAGLTTAQVITYGIHHDADVRATDIKMGSNGTTFVCHTFKGTVPISMRLVGTFNVYNVLGAIAASLVEGIDLQRIALSLENMPAVEGRMEVVEAGQPFLVLVDYAHTPDGLDNALSTIQQFAEGRIVTVFGCGGDRDRKKRPLMGKVTAEYSDYVIVTSDNPRSENPHAIMLDIEPGLIEEGITSDRYELIDDRREAIQKAIDLASPNDVVLIAGKGHETYQEIMGEKHDFDDRLVAKEAIRRRFP